MKEIFRDNNPVRLSYVHDLLGQHGIETLEFDRHASMIEGSISAIQRRIMVADDDASQALYLINQDPHLKS